MARPLRIQYEGAIYHVTVRGNARQSVFLDDSDREQFLTKLNRSIATYDIRLYLFCLMGNHFHLVLETPRGNLARFMQGFETAYAVYFNRRHQRVGHLTQGRYVAQLVEADAYLLRLSRYVHLNPAFVTAARQRPLEQRLRGLRSYRWSSYLSYIDQSPRLGFVEYAPILAYLECPKNQEAESYRQFVEGALAKTDQEFLRVVRASPRSIGSQRFRRWVDGVYRSLLRQRDKKEDVSFRRPPRNVPPEAILQIVGGELGIAREELVQRTRGSMARPVAAQMLSKFAGLSQRQTAEMLGLGTGAAVSMQLAKLRKILPINRSLQRAVTRIEERLEAALGSDLKISNKERSNAR